MKEKILKFRIAMAIVAMATLGMVTTSCSKDEDVLNSVDLQEQNDESSSLKSLTPPGDPVAQSTDDATMNYDTVYYSYFKRHYGGAYPNYVSYQFDFTSTQLGSLITPDPTTDSSSLSVGGLFTFFNQTAFKVNNSTNKGCPGFVVNPSYTVARYTGGNGVSTLRCLEKSDVTGLTYSTEGTIGTDFDLPFLKSDTTLTGYFGSYGLLQDSAYAYYDENLIIGRQFHDNCGGSYTTPIWVIRISDGGLGFYYYAFCIDPYQNGDTGGANSPDPDENKWWSTINYKKLN